MVTQTRYFASIGSSLWNAPSPYTRSQIITHSSACLKIHFFYRDLAHWEQGCCTNVFFRVSQHIGNANLGPLKGQTSKSVYDLGDRYWGNF